MNAFQAKSQQKQLGNQTGLNAEQAAAQLFDMANKQYKPEEVFKSARSFSKERSFAESFELILHLGVDPTQGD